MVIVLTIGIFAYRQYRKEIDCDRWREESRWPFMTRSGGVGR
jgi:hypothetical protein